MSGPAAAAGEDALPTGLTVATFHTFPAECAVVKTQTLIEPV